MNPGYPIVDPRIEHNRAHYYNSSRLRAYCCGCIHSESNTIFVCFFWAVISFYFAVLAFLQQSPFYSYNSTVPLVAFGAVNLLFGIVTLTSMVIFMFRTRLARMNSLMDSKKTVFAITANALGVLIVTLVNFILFVMNKSDFNNWCIGSSADYVENTYNQSNTNATIPGNVLSNSNDLYNCERLYQDEIKWSLLCLVIMCVVYIHWILIVAAKRTYGFYNTQIRDNNMNFEYANIAPSKKSGRMNIFQNIKPSRSLFKDILVHKQYDSFISSKDEVYDEEVDFNANDKTEPVNGNSNIIHFEDDIYASKEVQPPCVAYQKDTPNSSVINL